MERSPLPYVLIGVAAAGERRTRQVVSYGLRTTTIATRPVARVWASPLVGPLRRRATATSSELARDGRDLVERAGVRTRESVTELVRRLGDQLAASGIADDLVGWLLGSGAFDRVVTVVINHPATETLLTATLDDPALDRLVERIMQSRMVDELTARIIESEELQRVIDYVVRSPELRAALSSQTAGLAEDVATGVRSRTVRADDAAERIARALLRRPRRSTEVG